MSKTYAVSVPDSLVGQVEKLKEGPSELFQRAVKESEAPLMFCIPSAGGNLSLPTGTNTINFYTGSISKADGTTDKLVGNLKDYRRDFVRSLTINSDQTIKIHTDQRPGNKWSIDAYDTPSFTHLEYTILYIVTTTTTNVKLMASTNPDCILRRFLVNIQSPSSIISGQTTVGTTAVQLQSTSQAIKRVTVRADNDNTADVYTGGSNVTTANGYELRPSDVWYDDINDISVVYAISGTAGQKVFWLAVI